MLHWFRSLLYGWWRNQRGSQGTEAAGVALAAALIVAGVGLGARQYIVPAVEHAMACAAAVLDGGGTSCHPAKDSTADTPQTAALRYVATVRALLDRWHAGT